MDEDNKDINVPQKSNNVPAPNVIENIDSGSAPNQNTVENVDSNVYVPKSMSKNKTIFFVSLSILLIALGLFLYVITGDIAALAPIGASLLILTFVSMNNKRSDRPQQAFSKEQYKDVKKMIIIGLVTSTVLITGIVLLALNNAKDTDKKLGVSQNVSTNTYNASSKITTLEKIQSIKENNIKKSTLNIPEWGVKLEYSQVLGDLGYTITPDEDGEWESLKLNTNLTEINENKCFIFQQVSIGRSATSRDYGSQRRIVDRYNYGFAYPQLPACIEADEPVEYAKGAEIYQHLEDAFNSLSGLKQ